MTSVPLARTLSTRRLGAYLGIFLILLCLLLATIPQIASFGNLAFFFLGICANVTGLGIWLEARGRDVVVTEESPFLRGACAGATLTFWTILFVFFIWR